MKNCLTIAVSKGRVFDECVPMLARANIAPATYPDSTRKLVLNTNHAKIKLMIIRSQDVPTFVEYGAADCGIVGKDILMERQSDNLYEPLDLGISRCRMVVASRSSWRETNKRLKVATKYVNVARRFYASRGVQAEVIKLYGSMELAPAAGLADCIVDLVDTGDTLAANGLVERETIANISTRLVVNKAAMKMKHAPVMELIENLGRLARDNKNEA